MKELDISKLTKEERIEVAKHMYSPIRCGGCSYDQLGFYMILNGKKCRAKEINKIVMEMNPLWSKEALIKIRALYREDGLCGEKMTIED